MNIRLFNEPILGRYEIEKAKAKRRRKRIAKERRLEQIRIKEDRKRAMAKIMEVRKAVYDE